MTPSSAPSAPATKGRVPPDLGEGKSSLIFASNFNEAEESIRVLIRKHLPHGSKQELARLTNQHPNHVSSQLSGESGIHDKTVSAAVSIFRQYPELEAVVSAIHILRNGGSAAELREKTGLLIEFSNGQLCLPGLLGR
jgi:hypothetical protein